MDFTSPESGDRRWENEASPRAVKVTSRLRAADPLGHLVLVVSQHLGEVPAVKPLSADLAPDEVQAVLLLGPVVIVVPHHADFFAAFLAGDFFAAFFAAGFFGSGPFANLPPLMLFSR